MPDDPTEGSTPNRDQEDSGRDLLAYIAIRISPPPRPQPTVEGQEDQMSQEEKDEIKKKKEKDEIREKNIWNRLTSRRVRPRGSRDRTSALAARMTESLVPRVGIPLEIRVLPRRGTIELGVLILGSYALLKDYKPLRDSIVQLVNDIREFLGIPADWNVEVTEFRTPGTSIPEASASRVRQTAGGLIGMGVASRYAFLYLLILNILALVFFCYLTLTAVLANS
jgi:hypothetical protein